MQLRHGDNLGKGFCTSTRAYITALVPSALVLVQNPFPKFTKIVHGEIKHLPRVKTKQNGMEKAKYVFIFNMLERICFEKWKK